MPKPVNRMAISGLSIAGVQLTPPHWWYSDPGLVEYRNGSSICALISTSSPVGTWFVSYERSTKLYKYASLPAAMKAVTATCGRKP